MYYSNSFFAISVFLPPVIASRSESAGAEDKLYNYLSKKHNTQDDLHTAPVLTFGRLRGNGQRLGFLYEREHGFEMRVGIANMVHFTFGFGFPLCRCGVAICTDLCKAG
jgi:hypothetical protein